MWVHTGCMHINGHCQSSRCTLGISFKTTQPSNLSSLEANTSPSSSAAAADTPLSRVTASRRWMPATILATEMVLANSIISTSHVRMQSNSLARSTYKVQLLEANVAALLAHPVWQVRSNRASWLCKPNQVLQVSRLKRAQLSPVHKVLCRRTVPKQSLTQKGAHWQSAYGPGAECKDGDPGIQAQFKRDLLDLCCLIVAAAVHGRGGSCLLQSATTVHIAKRGWFTRRNESCRASLILVCRSRCSQAIAGFLGNILYRRRVAKLFRWGITSKVMARRWKSLGWETAR